MFVFVYMCLLKILYIKKILVVILDIKMNICTFHNLRMCEFI